MPSTAPAPATAAPGHEARIRGPFPGVGHDAFREAARRAGFSMDAAQRDAVARMIAPGRPNLYLHGPVGRGKSWLMDVAFAAARTERKRRVHVHDFFPSLHAAIFRSRHDLDAALDELIGDLDLLCFDEFHVHDVADGVLVRRLLGALAARGVATVVTSNDAPEELLPHPLFHRSFLPAIEEIRARFDVVEVDGGRDHREAGAASGFAAGAWVIGRGSAVPAGEDVVRCGERDLTVRAVDEQVLHATFADLCERPLAASDYAQLAELRGRWRILDVPPLEGITASAAQRFAHLVDVAADRGVRVRFHAAGPVDALADAPAPPLGLARTLSRLRSLRAEETP